MELAPLSTTYPSSNPPSFAPLAPEALAAAFMLQPGYYQLPEADRGIPVLSALDSAPVPVAAVAPAVPGAAPATAAPRAAAAAGKKPSLKFKVKIGGKLVGP